MAPTDSLSASAEVFFGERVSDQYREHYHLISSVFNGLVLAGAAIALLMILALPEAAGPRVAALALWLGSFGCLICTYNGPMVNSIFITRCPNLVDVVTPFLLGVLGFAQFALILPLQTAGGRPPSSEAQLDHLTWWFLAAAASWTVVLPHLANTLGQMRATVAESHVDLAPLIRWCETIVRKALQGTVAITIMLLVVFGLLRVGPRSRSLRAWQGPMGIAYFGGMVALIMIQERARRVIVASVSEGEPPSPTSGGSALDEQS